MRKLSILSVLVILLFNSGCAVYKAASNKGVSVQDVKKCQTEAALLARGMDVIERHESEHGEYTVTYRALARKSGANYARAAGHGILDVMTLGLWEVAGTPIEGAISNNRGYITVKALYAYKGKETIDSVCIYNANGELVITKNFNQIKS